MKSSLHFLSVACLALVLPLVTTLGATLDMGLVAQETDYFYPPGFVFSSPQRVHSSPLVNMPGTAYRLTTASGAVTEVDASGSGFGSSQTYTSYDAFRASEAGVWNLVTDPGLLTETSYYFNVNFFAMEVQSFSLNVFHTPGAPENHVNIEIDGPVDAGPFQLWINSSGAGGNKSEKFALDAGTTSYFASLMDGFNNVGIAAVRSSSIAFFEATVPTTNGGIQLPDWSIGYSVINEIGSYSGSAVPDRAASRVPEMGSSLGMLVSALGGLVLMRRRAQALSGSAK
jgi:hypothetical protein